MSSVLTDLNTYVFTAVTISSLTVIAVACLLMSTFWRTDHHFHGGRHKTSSSPVNDWLLVTVVMVLATAIRWRLAAMERATEQIATATGYVSLASTYRMHATSVSCATVLAVVALLKLTKPWLPSPSCLSLVTATVVVSISIFVFSANHHYEDNSSVLT
ncbi:Hypothetical protein CINCED_3A012585 [Cinara cedri]|uniref:Uncharacterized protein n=1 Tax=Cinara cedri TaxID=506608 RepID=A0A5E4MYW7_9HEMI|nr:Hypothetical protein CINCED_3A012585 [Cinara cedri]